MFALTCTACGLTVHADDWVDHRRTDCVDSHDAVAQRRRDAAARMRQARAEAVDSQPNGR